MKWLHFNWLGFDDNSISSHKESNKGSIVTPETEIEIASSLPFLRPKMKEKHLTPDYMKTHLMKISEASPFITHIDVNNPISYALPFRHNHGKPPHRYSPDFTE